MARVPLKVREAVRQRARFRCEYCLIPEEYHPLPNFHIDHIFSLKHGGRSDLSNLALACPECNRKKGTVIGSRKRPDGELIRLYNPRNDSWEEHFVFNWAFIRSTSDIGEVTVNILGLNDGFRVTFREYLMLIGVYP